MRAKHLNFGVLEASLVAVVGLLALPLSILGAGWLGDIAPKMASGFPGPAPGALAMLPGTDSLGRPVARTEKRLLVHLGQCGECQVNGFDTRKLKVPHGVHYEAH